MNERRSVRTLPTRLRRLPASVGLVTVALVTIPAPGVHAATLTVTTLADSGPGSFRQAVLDANASAGTDVIDLTGLAGTIALTGGWVQITDSVQITGPGAPTLTIDAGGGLIGLEVIAAAPIRVSISGVRVSGATAAGGRAIDSTNASLTLDGVQAVGNGRGVYVSAFDDPANTVVIRDSVVSGNTQNGGLVVANTVAGSAVTIERTTIADNRAPGGFGAGILLSGAADVTVADSTVARNVAGTEGGGVEVVYSTGRTLITRSSIVGNTAGTSGGGIYLAATSRPVEIANSTVAGNIALGPLGGGGIHADDGAALTLRTATVVGNSAGATGGGLYVDHGTVTIDSSILAGNSAAAGVEDLGPAVGPTFELAYSLVQRAAAVPVVDLAGSFVGIDPLLEAFDATTGTASPSAGSPVLEAGNPADLADPSDQLGRPRRFNRLDMGAVERQALPVYPPAFGLVEPAITAVDGAPIAGGIGVTSAPSPVLSGTGRPGAQIVVYTADRSAPIGPAPPSGVPVCSAIVGADGTWSCRLADLPTGGYDLVPYATSGGSAVTGPTVHVLVSIATAEILPATE
mgnify:CR=1 FL=1